MIIVNLSGGLGNQMFQYALGRNISLKLNTELKFDLSYTRRGELSNYGLHVFNIVEAFFDKEEFCKDNCDFKYTENALIFKSEFLPMVSASYSYIKEKNFRFDNDILNSLDNSYLDGYFQSEKYFLENRRTILSDFTLKNSIDSNNMEVISTIESNNSVSMHIRRGDYLNKEVSAILNICDLSYYKRAVDAILKLTHSPYFFIFSDDINWAKENLSFINNISFIDINTGSDSYKDLILMSLCNHNIIANSSFSWWAAWINKNPSKIVISPKKWFNINSRNSKNDQDIRPESWVQI